MDEPHHPLTRPGQLDHLQTLGTCLRGRDLSLAEDIKFTFTMSPALTPNLETGECEIGLKY